MQSDTSYLIQAIQKVLVGCTKCLVCQKSDTGAQLSIRQVNGPFLVLLRMDIADSFDIVESQIRQMINQSDLANHPIENVILAIDFSLPAKQLDLHTAQQIAQTTLQTVDQCYPAIRDRFVGISDDAKILPLRDLMQTGKLALEEIDNQHLFVFE